MDSHMMFKLEEHGLIEVRMNMGFNDENPGRGLQG